MTEQEQADLTLLHVMAMTNVAGLDFETFKKRNEEYHAHKDKCVALYGWERTRHAEYYGLPSPAGDGETK